MIHKPTVSVLMPVYNADQYLAQAVESILNQTFQDFELIIIDDGSTDHSLEILQRYAAQDKRIHLTHSENSGIAKTTNKMLSQANGEFIALMDNDDIAVPSRLAWQVDLLRNQPDVVGVSGALQFIDEQGRLLLTESPVPQDDEEIQQLLLSGYANNFPHPCAMLRRTALVEIGGYNETLVVAADLDMMLRIGEVGKLANLKEPILKYRVHMNSACGQKYELYRQEALAACQRAWQRRGIEGHFASGEEEQIRPGTDRFSQYPFLVKYGWWAFNSGQRRTAMLYALRAITSVPVAAPGWKLLVCAAVKPLNRST
jgi:glycosyltransferase involved in cell wall biosynthesis